MARNQSNEKNFRIQILNLKLMSNNRRGDEAYEFMDSQIRESEMRRLKLEATPNQNGDIKTTSLLVKGALKVAQSNGYAQATIVENNTRIKIDTKTHLFI